LAEKEGYFADKRGFHGKYFELFFVVFMFFVFVSVATRCLSTTSGDQDPPKKIMPKTLP
jgi:hypothetical protein